MLNSVLDRRDPFFSGERLVAPQRTVDAESEGTQPGAEQAQEIATAEPEPLTNDEMLVILAAIRLRRQAGLPDIDGVTWLAENRQAKVLYSIDRPEIRYYLGRSESWDRDDWTVFHRFLVETAIADGLRQSAYVSNFPSFKAYVSRWTSDLTDVSLARLSYEKQTAILAELNLQIPWRPAHPAEENTPHGYAGFLFSSIEPDQTDLSSAGLSMKRMLNSCLGRSKRRDGGLGGLQPPRQLSSGFHQVFPIVVQLGLMCHGELVGIENPEVHLHPSMQLQVAKMLIDHAKSGRLIFAETHSDLLIRRVMRAIVAEEITQSCVHVYFVDLQKSTESEAITGAPGYEVEFRHSTLNKLQVDERGRIANWPEGFLDDDVRESQRLLDIMYGGSEEGGDEDA